MTAPTSNVKQLATREQIFKFEDGEETITVKTVELPNGEVIAFNNDDSDPLAFGHGFSTIGAIADLFKKLPAAVSEREERDLLAERWDHARDLRKHSF